MTLDEQIQLITDSALPDSRKHGCRLLTFGLYSIRDKETPTRAKDIKNRIRKEFPLNAYELENYEKSGYPRWETLVQMFSIDYVKAGFIEKTRQGWLVTPEGRLAKSGGQRPDRNVSRGHETLPSLEQSQPQG